MGDYTQQRILYLFLDEGGNLDFSLSGSQYIIFTSVTKLRPFGIHARLSNLKYDLLEQGLDMEYFHAAEDRQAVRNMVFEVIKENLGALRIDSLVVEKRKTGPALQRLERFYPRMLAYLLRYAIGGVDVGSYDQVIILTDSVPVKRQREAVEKGVKTTLADMLPGGLRYQVLHHASKSSFGLQIADYCNWAIFRKWERNDQRSYDLIRGAIRSEFDIFRSGSRFYY